MLQPGMTAGLFRRLTQTGNHESFRVLLCSMIMLNTKPAFRSIWKEACPKSKHALQLAFLCFTSV